MQLQRNLYTQDAGQIDGRFLLLLFFWFSCLPCRGSTDLSWLYEVTGIRDVSEANLVDSLELIMDRPLNPTTLNALGTFGCLRQLRLVQQHIQTLEFAGVCKSLQVLHLPENQIERLEGTLARIHTAFPRCIRHDERTTSSCGSRSPFYGCLSFFIESSALLGCARLLLSTTS